MTGYFHLNGTTYEYAHDVPSADDSQWQKVVQPLEAALRGGGQASVAVKIEDQQVDLHIDGARVSSWAVWVVDRTPNIHI